LYGKRKPVCSGRASGRLPDGERCPLRDGDADTLVLSVDSVLASDQCGAAPVSKNLPDGQGGFRYPAGA
jgi:hypothetical protein